MMSLEPSNVRLRASVATKTEAIELAAALLADSGHIDPAYARSMLGREEVANTYLGEGIAIPHGLPQDRHLIRRTGIAVVQVPDGVEWNPGETVRLVVGIAAASDEHLQILANLTQVLADPEEIERLATTGDPALVVDRLSQTPGRTTPSAPAVELEGSVRRDVVIGGSAGLHARPATFLVDVARGFEADLQVRSGERVVSARSLASLLALGVESGTTVTLLARGPDQDAALAALVEAVESGLGEDEDDVGDDHGAIAPAAPSWQPTEPGSATPLSGISASPGIAIAPLWHLERQRLVVVPTAGDSAAEERALQRALEVARSELRQLRADVAARSGAAKAAIFGAHEAFLDDPELTNAVVTAIRAGASAGWAWQQVLDAKVAELERVDDPLLAARAADLGDVARRVLRRLAQTEEVDPELPEHPVVLLADDLSPSDTAAIDPERVVGFCTALGGPTSHTAIVARALGIPAVVGAGPAALAQPEGAVAVLDGSGGTLWVGLSDDDIRSAHDARLGLDAVRAAEHDTRFQPALTLDGHRVEVVANVNQASEAVAAVEAGAEGVGLMRTEFLFLGRDAAPTEDEQFEALAAMVGALGGLPLIVRTLDIGGDKNAPYLDVPAEDNSFLGMRGIRLCLARPELFQAQLRAIYRASEVGPVAVMFPMIARLEDLEAALDSAEQARQAVGAAPIDVGIMIEVPSAVALAPELARRVQFFSVGTNDLTQYVLAMDRLHPVLAKQTDALHPAVLRMIDATVKAADGAGIWVGVCGGVAGEPLGATILTGLGVRELSVSVPAVAAIKAHLRSSTRADARRLAERALACSTATEVRGLARP